jgi:hypothetical protein
MIEIDIFGTETAVEAPAPTPVVEPKRKPAAVQTSLFGVTRAVPGITRSIAYTEPELF